MSTYPAGTVAIATVKGVKGVRVFRYAEAWGSLNWVSAASVGDSTHIVHSDRAVTDIRPLVVLDLDAANPHGSPTIKLSNLLEQLRKGTDVCRGVADQIAAQTARQKIPEPGMYGVVSSMLHGGLARWKFARGEYGWICLDDGTAHGWDSLKDPTLIREGLS